MGMHQPWYRIAGRQKQTCAECGDEQIGCRAFSRRIDGSFAYVCASCWLEKGYGAPAAKPYYLKKDECPVTQ